MLPPLIVPVKILLALTVVTEVVKESPLLSLGFPLLLALAVMEGAVETVDTPGDEINPGGSLLCVVGVDGTSSFFMVYFYWRTFFSTNCHTY